MAKFNSEEFSKLNKKRCIEGFHHDLKEWSTAEWTNALCGEAGEAANFAKKIIRHRTEAHILNKGIGKEELIEKLMQELADTVIYADLAAQSLGKDLWEYIVKTFNNKSKEINLGKEFIIDET